MKTSFAILFILLLTQPLFATQDDVNPHIIWEGWTKNRALMIDDWDPGNPDVQKLCFRQDPLTQPKDETIVDLGFLVHFSHVTHLDLGFCRKIKDSIGKLALLVNLRVLDLQMTEIETLKPLRHLSQLRVLNARGTCIKSIEPISGLPLKKLSLAGESYITDLPLLGKIITLQELNLGLALDGEEMNYPSLDFLKPLVHLRKLALDRNDMLRDRDIEAVATLPNIEDLDLDDIKGVRSLAPLGKMQSLTALNIHYAPQVKDYSFLQTLPNLRILAVERSVEIPKMSLSVKIYQ